MRMVIMTEGVANVSDGCSGIGRVRRFCSVETGRDPYEKRSSICSRHDQPVSPVFVRE